MDSWNRERTLKAPDNLAAYEETGYSPEDILQRLPKRKYGKNNIPNNGHKIMCDKGWFIPSF